MVKPVLLTMNDPVSQIQKKENRRMLLWFLLAIAVALLPWFLLAGDQFSGKETVKTSEPAKECHRGAHRL
jgi:hypothetical protein